MESLFKVMRQHQAIYRKAFVLLLFASAGQLAAQLNPAITRWLQNTTTTGSYYKSGNPVAINNGILVNCQKVEYSGNWVYVSTKGIPSYPTGPFLDNNPSQASSQNAIFKISLNPVKNTGTPTATTGGNIGIFINGVALFDYRDGVAWNTATNAPCGGPGNPPCPGGPAATMPWNRDAVVAERGGFDCAKGHPAMGNYHHHQNPSAFKLDKKVISTICNLYDAEGLYVIDSTNHSPLLGFAYDGFPIYGAYAFKNANGTGAITRMKSGYQLRNITSRTHWADGTNVDDGPPVNATYPIGYYREDYEYIAHPNDPDYLDEHNGRFCITPEYPNGIYCYFTTVDANWNSAYPYVVGPTFYGTRTAQKVNAVNEVTTIYNVITGITETDFNQWNFSIYPNPAGDLLAVQAGDLVEQDLIIDLVDVSGRTVKRTTLPKGSTIAYFDTQTLYEGLYWIKVSTSGLTKSYQVVLARD